MSTEPPPDAAAGADSPATLMESAYSRSYGAFYGRHWWWRARENHVLHFVRRFATWRERGAKILDDGCGDGLIWPRLATVGEVQGIEPDAGQIAPDSPVRDRIEVSGFLTARPRPADHDLVLMLDVLEHIEEEQRALVRVRELLGAHGRFVLTVPALPALWSKFDEMSGHYRRYTKRSLRSALEAAGLRVLSVRYCYLWTVPPLFARRFFFRATAGEDSSFVQPPPGPVNSLLYAVSRVDHALFRRVPVPAGSSLIAVAARRPAAGASRDEGRA
ncbi:class I SAM-dependent DNA methyltransferase [Streptomyces sp. NPDC057743]|uniref:class I SAM-dependent DNA methyltransferase n=1 Tax=Streptomyces sp. NPDC057743 TaxID=3346236 RepID=UPI003681FCE1